MPVAAEDLGCTVARCSGRAPSARRSRVCERERCRGCCRTPPRPGLCPHAPVSTAMLRRARGWLRSERLSGGAAGRWRGWVRVVAGLGDPAPCRAGRARDFLPAERGGRASPNTVCCLFNSIRLPASFSLVYCNIGRVFIYLILYSVITIVG